MIIAMISAMMMWNIIMHHHEEGGKPKEEYGKCIFQRLNYFVANLESFLVMQQGFTKNLF